MVGIDERLVSAIISLEGNKDFVTVVEWLSDNLNEEELNNRTIKDEVFLRWGQGHVQILSDTLSTIINSRSLKQQFHRTP